MIGGILSTLQNLRGGFCPPCHKLQGVLCPPCKKHEGCFVHLCQNEQGVFCPGGVLSYIRGVGVKVYFCQAFTPFTAATHYLKQTGDMIIFAHLFKDLHHR